MATLKLIRSDFVCKQPSSLSLFHLMHHLQLLPFLTPTFLKHFFNQKHYPENKSSPLISMLLCMIIISIISDQMDEWTIFSQMDQWTILSSSVKLCECSRKRKKNCRQFSFLSETISFALSMID